MVESEHIHCGHRVAVGHIAVWQCCRCKRESLTLPLSWKIGDWSIISCKREVDAE